jgi:hypothetical protein
MRRTTITNMLMHGTNESIVRKVSGHSAGSKEFYKYVQFAQPFMDEETDKYFKKLETFGF